MFRSFILNLKNLDLGFHCNILLTLYEKREFLY